ncbi:hypothetical protein [Intestinibacter bartlettii]|uniref:hypothetical protein n=1 Tax=Intestinibacter bartlettii TaxID=261299 RepID=UPI001106E8C7|nr:hypothetical protein [Intestinibacter bartlettii]
MKKNRMIFIILLIFVILSIALFNVKNNKDYNENLGHTSLYVETYLAGKNQLTHPNVIKFDKPWHGYKYWMGYTPYPNGDGEEENPSIAASNDMYKWETPKNLANPIADNEETGCNELKDSQLIYRDDLDRLEMWYLGRVSKNLGGDGETLLLFRKTSKDGINWSKYQVIREFKYVSPAIIWDGEKYCVWGIGFEGQGTKGVFDYFESKDGTNWSDPVHCKIGNDSKTLDMWHGNVTYNEKLKCYELVYIPTSNQEVYYTTSKDKINFDKPKTIVENDGTWTRLYRPTLLFENNQYYCIYGSIGENNENYISMSTGKDINNLTGISDKDISEMADTPMEKCKEKIPFMERLSELKKTFFRLELLVFIPLLFVLGIIFEKNHKSDINRIIIITSLLICEFYMFLKVNFSSIESIVAGLIMGVIQAFVLTSGTMYLLFISKKYK